MVTRRGFLGKLGAVVAAGLVGPTLAKISPPPPPRLPPLLFHKDAFGSLFNPSVDLAAQYRRGMIEFRAGDWPLPQRLDVLYGVGYTRTLSPQGDARMVRIASA